MPVPKKKQKLYGKIVGANINRGKSLKQAKKIADKAVGVAEDKDKEQEGKK